MVDFIHSTNLIKFMPHYKQLGKFLKRKRTQFDFSQSELAEEIQIHPQFVSNWERGVCAPPHHSIKSLIKILKINKGELIDIMMIDCRRNIEERILGKSRSSSSSRKKRK